ncbi:hypothetical protein CONPUDRAFT_142910 [Coniophora puteana RWD-64-598 SS2]|uniref:Uncharacterized protein n=1 Tax=Coniophora puteana (strain RWD-64-598) TaxID=741705 RepID=A0A5M3MU95_CONPW|nr:uncharacterized protein CONPUDRAFT_142910 [Coniophora puteana RWD-64-598 SS2]EIW82738.1 hypothetical protein CONPUDRAFT_142910 [Coniophora puteana RWD-64-598 SS2]
MQMFSRPPLAFFERQKVTSQLAAQTLMDSVPTGALPRPALPCRLYARAYMHTYAIATYHDELAGEIPPKTDLHLASPSPTAKDLRRVPDSRP